MQGLAKRPLSTVQHSTTFHVSDTAIHEKDQGLAVWKELKTHNPNLLFIVARSCNVNVVAYDARVDVKHPTRMNSKDVIDIYWLNLEPKYTENARKKGVAHDRDELSWIERKLGYGAITKELKQSVGCYRIKMNAMTSLKIKLGIESTTNQPRAYLRLDPTGKHKPGSSNAIDCFLDRIYVNVVWKLSGPDVDWLIYYGTSVADGKPMEQKVVRF